MMELAIVGPSYMSRSRNFDCQRTINLYPEASGSGSSKRIAMLIGTPGLATWVTLGDAPVRGMLKFSATQAIMVAGGSVYLVDTSANAALIGTIINGTGPVSMASNGTIVMLVTGSIDGYIITPSSGTVAPITDPDFVGATRVEYIDGYFAFNKVGTGRFQISDLFSSVIDPTNIATAEGDPDNIVSLIVAHNEIMLFGEVTTEPWFDSGGPDFPFQRINGAFMEIGCAAAYSVVKMVDAIYWLGANKEGTGIVFRASGYTPQRISTHAIELAIQGYSRIDDAEAYTYQQEGHSFYVLTFPTANATWVFDASTELWHERAWRNPADASLNRHRGRCQVAFAGKILVGDWENGKVYALDLDTYTDAGDILPAIRQTPHNIAPSNLWQFFHKLWIDVQTGVGLVSGQGSSPKVILEWSDDGGYVFNGYMEVSLGKIGERRARANFRRLGKSRDRVWRITITDPVKRILIGAEVEMTEAAA